MISESLSSFTAEQLQFIIAKISQCPFPEFSGRFVNLLGDIANLGAQTDAKNMAVELLLHLIVDEHANQGVLFFSISLFTFVFCQCIVATVATLNFYSDGFWLI